MQILIDWDDLNNPLFKTIEGMLSKDYKERFRAEYAQLCYRYNALIEFRERMSAYNEYNVSLNLLCDQIKAMGDYINVLEKRARWEKIELNDLDW